MSGPLVPSGGSIKNGTVTYSSAYHYPKDPFVELKHIVMLFFLENSLKLQTRVLSQLML